MLIKDHILLLQNWDHQFPNMINIEKMETEIDNAPISGFPMFVLSSILNIPCDLDFNTFKKSLKGIAQENNIEYKLGILN